MEMMRGRITKFFADRNYGFLRGNDGQDFFFHKDDITDDLTPAVGTLVSFHPGVYRERTKAMGICCVPGPIDVLGNSTIKENLNVRPSCPSGR